MLKRAVEFFPAIKDLNFIRAFAGLRPFTPDGLPLIGEVDKIKGFYIAAGHEGDGIALAPILILMEHRHILYLYSQFFPFQNLIYLNRYYFQL